MQAILMSICLLLIEECVNAKDTRDAITPFPRIEPGWAFIWIRADNTKWTAKTHVIYWFYVLSLLLTFTFSKSTSPMLLVVHHSHFLHMPYNCSNYSFSSVWFCIWHLSFVLSFILEFTGLARWLRRIFIARHGRYTTSLASDALNRARYMMPPAPCSTKIKTSIDVPIAQCVNVFRLFLKRMFVLV